MITMLRRFFRLAPADRIRVIRAAVVIGAIRVGLKLVPYRWVSSLVARVSRSRHSPTYERASTDRVTWAVSAVGRQMPRAATCLTRAMAGQVLLGWQGEPSELRLGVAKDDRGMLQAHAWLESKGVVVIGGEVELGEFTPLARDGAAPQ